MSLKPDWFRLLFTLSSTYGSIIFPKRKDDAGEGNGPTMSELYKSGDENGVAFVQRNATDVMNRKKGFAYIFKLEKIKK